MSSPADSSNLKSLDLLRGLMAVLVFLSHTAIFTGGLDSFAVYFFKTGGAAVEVFMFVSGFLMMWHFLERRQAEPWEAGTTWLRFYLRRSFRIAPLYYLLLTAAFLMQSHGFRWLDHLQQVFPPPWHNLPTPHDPTNHALSFANLSAHYSFLFGVIPAYASNTLLPDWSIGLEMQFYVAFPLLALLVARWGNLPTTALVGVLWFAAVRTIAVGKNSEPGPLGLFPMPSFLPLRLGIFWSGILAAQAILRLGKGERPWLLLGGSALFAILHDKRLAVVVIAFLAYESTIRWPRLHPRMKTVVGVCQRLLASRPVGFLADCSYGVYLLHMLLLSPVVYLLSLHTSFAQWPVAARFPVAFGASGALVFTGAAILHRFVEQPGIELGKKKLRQWLPKKSV